jgi:hypothetical protein
LPHAMGLSAISPPVRGCDTDLVALKITELTAALYLKGGTGQQRRNGAAYATFSY